MVDGGVQVMALAPAWMVSKMASSLGPPVAMMGISGWRSRSAATSCGVSAAAETPAVVRRIREQHPDVPIIATGGPTDESILETIQAGANAISYTPPSTKELFRVIMTGYRENDTAKAEPLEEEDLLELL